MQDSLKIVHVTDWFSKSAYLSHEASGTKKRAAGCSSLTITVDYQNLKQQINTALAKGQGSSFSEALNLFEEHILELERRGDRRQALNVKAILIDLLKDVRQKVDTETKDYYGPFGRYYLVAANGLLAKVYERSEDDYELAILHRTEVVKLTEASHRLESVILVVIDLLTVGNLRYAKRFVEYAFSIRKTVLDELTEEGPPSRGFMGLGGASSAEGNAENAFGFFSEFLKALLLAAAKEGQADLVKETEKPLNKLLASTRINSDYVMERLHSLNAQIRSKTTPVTREDADSEFLISTIVPFTIDCGDMKKLAKTMHKHYKSSGVPLPVQLSHVPVLGPSRAAAPHVVVIGQSGSGKTTFTKHMIRENLKLPYTGAIILDRHMEYANLSKTVIQLGLKKSHKTKFFISLEKMRAAYDKNVELMEKRIKEVSEQTDIRRAAEIIQSVSVQSDLVLSNFVKESTKKLIEDNKKVLFNLDAGEAIVVWVNSGEPKIDEIIIDLLLERIFIYATQETKLRTTIFVNEESHRIKNSPHVRRIASEGRKFGLVMVSVSQRPDFDEWVIGNSRPIIFKLNYQDVKEIEEAYHDLAYPKLIPALEVGEYLALDMDWFISYLPESLLSIHAQEIVNDRMKYYQKAKKAKLG